MTVYTLDTPQNGRISYRDNKRYWWLLSIFNPLLGFVGIGLHAATGNEWLLLFPLVFSYGVGPILDWWWGEDENNPPEEIVPLLEQDPYYRYLTYLAVPLQFIGFLGIAIWIGTQNLSPVGYICLTVVAGLGSGLGINTGHELGHKNTRLERWLAKIVLAVPAYGHFWIEHNLGHHRDVATPEDPASSRMGESFYRFIWREIPGAFVRAWKLERQRLAREGKPVWHWYNSILQSFAITLVLQVGLVAVFGWIMVPFLLVHNVLAWLQLTSANYVEHYGLLRQKMANGRYETTKPWHSWNSNHKFTNLMLFHLERHSDHHANPARRYQSLRHFEDLPQLPNGYYGMFLVAYIPWLWFRIMDPLLLQLKHVQGDLSKVNIDPHKRDEIYARYGG